MRNTWLAHHGVLGQKWGVRHDEYPLEPGEHTSAEKKAGWKKSLDSDSDSDSGKKKKDYGVTEATKKRQAKDRLKTALVAGGIAAGAAALYAAYTAKKSDQAIRFISDGMLKLDVKSAVVQGAIDAGKAFVIGGAGAYAAKAFYHHRRNKAIAEQRERKANNG